MEKKKYISPNSEFVDLNLMLPIAQGGIGVNGSDPDDEQLGKKVGFDDFENFSFEDGGVGEWSSDWSSEWKTDEE
ncbi:MAG: hypothetical protein J6N73_05370 [Prevotella sp.]|nr:hypothetical protein [Prevotella sp.]